MRPYSDRPQLLVWGEGAGSDEKRCLAATALRRGLTPGTLAKKVGDGGVDPGWLGRWFRRPNNGAGETLRDVCRALRVSTSDPFANYERELLDLIRTAGKQHFQNAPALAQRVSKALQSSLRPKVLGRYALARAKQEQALIHSLATIKPRPNLQVPWEEPPDAFEACLAAITALGLQIPVRADANQRALALALFEYVRALGNFTRYGTSKPFFDSEQALAQICAALHHGKWPRALLIEAEREAREWLNLPTKGTKS